MTDSEIVQIVQALQKVEKKVDRIYQGLYGIDDTLDKGFCGRLYSLEWDYYKFKGRVLIIIAFSAGGGGALGVGLSRLFGV